MSRNHRQSGTVLVLSQVYAPDPAAVGQYMADAAARIASRGVEVRVLTAARGYEDPSKRYPARDQIDGVAIRRLPLSSAGKATLTSRLFGQVSFVLQCVAHGLFTPNLRAVFCTTSPPFGAAAGLLIARIRRVPFHYWLMDINPDQAVTSGQLRRTSLLVRALDWLNRLILRRATTVIALDRFMEERMRSKTVDARARLEIIPPWPLDTHLGPVDPDTKQFRQKHGLVGKRVVMYSGNHSPVHPLDTLLAAAKRLEEQEDLVFVFVGGGLEKRKIRDAIEVGARNLLSLPYQPLDEIPVSLSAADVHVVVLGDNMRGIVHPSKLYNAMLVGRPILYFGPGLSHVTELLDRHTIGWKVAHGDVDGAVKTLTEIENMPEATLRDLGGRAREVVLDEVNPEALSGRLCDIVVGG